MVIRVEFIEPLHISTTSLDSLVVTFPNTSLLMDEHGLHLAEGTRLERSVPPQFSQSEAQFYASLADTFSSIETGSLVADTILNAM